MVSMGCRGNRKHELTRRGAHDSLRTLSIQTGQRCRVRQLVYIERARHMQHRPSRINICDRHFAHNGTRIVSDRKSYHWYATVPTQRRTCELRNAACPRAPPKSYGHARPPTTRRPRQWWFLSFPTLALLQRPPLYLPSLNVIPQCPRITHNHGYPGHLLISLARDNLYHPLRFPPPSRSSIPTHGSLSGLISTRHRIYLSLSMGPQGAVKLAGFTNSSHTWECVRSVWMQWRRTTLHNL
jgi:hypothetical protein